MRVRIIKELPRIIEGVSFEQYQVQRVYDVSPRLAALLVAGGFAMFEKRDPDRPDDGTRSGRK